MKWMFFLVLAVGLVLSGSVSSMPQAHTSTLEGLVLGPDNKPVANAAVTYQSGEAAHHTWCTRTGRGDSRCRSCEPIFTTCGRPRKGFIRTGRRT